MGLGGGDEGTKAHPALPEPVNPLPSPKTLAHLHQPPPMARSSSLSEAEAGISCFASSLPGFRGVLKHRYSDFIVHEVARDGTLVQLTSFDLPTEVSGPHCKFEFTTAHLRSQSRCQM